MMPCLIFGGTALTTSALFSNLLRAEEEKGRLKSYS